MDPGYLSNLVRVHSRPVEELPSQALEHLSPAVTAPAKATTSRHHIRHGQQEQDGFELQRSSILPAAEPTSSKDPELSRSISPDLVEVVPSVWDPYMNRYRLMSLCLMNLGGAMNDGAAGALIPYMEKYYHIGYAVISLIFVGQAVGFILAAALLDSLRHKLGRAYLLGLGQALLVSGFIPIVCASPFPVIVVSFSLVGFGQAVNVAMANTFAGGLQNGTIMLGLVHGSYGIGGTTGPLIATAIVTLANAIWSRYYLLTLGIGAITFFLSVYSFWNYEKEMIPAVREREIAAGSRSSLWSMVRSLQLRIVLLGSVFIFAYQGAEVSISGWVISYLINARNGDPSSVGYVSAGFWAGITIGRFFLSVPAQRIGEKSFVYVIIAGALAFQILVWFVPNIIGEAVAVAIVGLLLGPIYPCAATVFMRGLTRRESLSGMSTVSAFGSLGGALAPFVTGMLAQVVGTWVLHPIVIFLFMVMLVCWYGIPTERKRTE